MRHPPTRPPRADPNEAYRATFGGALASRELGFGRSGSDRYLSLHCGLVTRVRGRTPFGAYCPKPSLAREASTLSLATCLPGFPGVVLIPLGRLSTSPIPLLARVALWFHHPHLRAGYIHARRISESSKAYPPLHDSPVAMHNAAETTSRASKSDAGGLGKVSALSHTPTERVHGEFPITSTRLFSRFLGHDCVTSNPKDPSLRKSPNTTVFRPTSPTPHRPAARSRPGTGLARHGEGPSHTSLMEF